MEQVPDIDAVVIPTGGGGLIAGVALAVKTIHPHVKIIVRTASRSHPSKNPGKLFQGVESERCAGFSKALEAGKPVPVAIDSTLADGLAVPIAGFNAYETAKSLIDKMV